MLKKRYILTFPIETVEEPIIYNLVKEYDLKINIINADISPGQEGKLLIGIWGEEENIEKGVKHLEGNLIKCSPAGKKLMHNDKSCIHCGACSSVCFSNALNLDDNAQLNFNRENCIVCGFCVKACPFNCFEIGFE